MTTSSREALARGDMVALVESVGPDEFERFDVDLSPLGRIEATFARVGLTVIAITPHMGVGIFVFEDEDAAHVEYQRGVDQSREATERLVAAHAQGPAAFFAMIREALDGLQGDGEATVPIPAARYRAPVPGTYEVSATSPPTGLYL